MSQPSLFDTTDAFVVDDGKGRVSYAPGFVDARTAAAWFAELRSGVEWPAERGMMSDREVDLPRLVAHFRLHPAPASTPGAILEAARLVTKRLDAPFNAVGLNLYRDGRDSVAPHNDHLNELRKGFPIALVSLGATRRMTILPKQPPRKPVNIDLETGSLLVMEYDTQLHYTHGVPKTPESVGERISLAFRVRPNAQSKSRAVYGV